MCVHVGALALLALAGCGRVGFEMAPATLTESEPGDEPDDDEPAADAEAGADAHVAAQHDAGEQADRDAQAGLDAQAALDAQLDVDAGADAQTGADAQVARDAQAGMDAAGADAQAGTDAQVVRDAGTDAAPIADAAADAAQPATGLRVIVDYSAGSGTLSDYPVRVVMDTRSLIQQRQLAADCSDLRVFGGSGCAEARSYFLAAFGCNTASTEVWLRVPQLRGGTREVLDVRFDAAGGEASNGSRVFPFFDDFDGGTLDRTRWIARGGGSVSVSGGVLQSQGIMQLQSTARAVSAGQSVIGARMALLGEYDTDVELGVGEVSTDNLIWAFGRTWDGVTFVSYSATTYAFDSAPGTRCDDMANSQIPASIGANWADTSPATASFLTAEFGYANRSGTAEAWLRTSRGASLRYTAPSGCALAAALPVLITLDHNAPSTPTQRVDYVYVRPAAASEPSASVQTSSLACGSAP